MEREIVEYFVTRLCNFYNLYGLEKIEAFRETMLSGARAKFGFGVTKENLEDALEASIGAFCEEAKRKKTAEIKPKELVEGILDSVDRIHLEVR